MIMCVFQLPIFSFDGCENVYTASYYQHLIGNMNSWIIAHYLVLDDLWFGSDNEQELCC